MGCEKKINKPVRGIEANNVILIDKEIFFLIWLYLFNSASSDKLGIIFITNADVTVTICC